MNIVSARRREERKVDLHLRNKGGSEELFTAVPSAVSVIDFRQCSRAKGWFNKNQGVFSIRIDRQKDENFSVLLLLNHTTELPIVDKNSWKE